MAFVSRHDRLLRSITDHCNISFLLVNNHRFIINSMFDINGISIKKKENLLSLESQDPIFKDMNQYYETV